LATLSNDKYALFCQEIKRLEIKETGLRLAVESGNSQFVEGFSKQIEELNANVNKYSGEYINAIHELSGSRDAKVHQIFSEPEGSVEFGQAGYKETDKAVRAKFWALTGADYEHLKASGESPTREKMQEKCPR
jgi:hypothetical protein